MGRGLTSLLPASDAPSDGDDEEEDDADDIQAHVPHTQELVVFQETSVVDPSRLMASLSSLSSLSKNVLPSSPQSQSQAPAP